MPGHLCDTHEGMCRKWEKVLKVPVSPDDDLFERLGADSLSVVQLAQALTCEVVDLYDHPTPRRLCHASGFDLDSAVRTDAASLRAEAAIIAKAAFNKPRVTKHEEVKSVLLTGVTGLIGCHVLHQLLQQPHVERVVCIVRASDANAALERIETKLISRGLQCSPKALNKVHALAGDLSSERLGLSIKVWEELQAQVDSIIHGGADVNWLKSYRALMGSNVSGVMEILKLAAQGPKAIRLVHVSTMGVEPSGNFEQTDQSRVVRKNGYSQTKWVAEQAVIGAFEQEGCIPIAAVRPGLVLEDYAHGEFDRNQWFPTFVAKCLQDGKMPLIELEGTPVEQICQSIVRMAVCEPTSNTVGGVHEKDRDTRLFHNLCTFYKADRLADELNKALAHDGNTTTTEGDSLKRKLASDKPLLQVVPMEEWKRSMLSVPQDQQVHPIYRFTAKMKGLRENSYGSFEVQHGRPYAEDWSALIGRVLGLRDFNLATAAADAAATRDDIRRADKRPRVNDVGTGKVGSGKLVVLFPGQGTQRVGMMAKTLETPEAQWVLQEAAQVLGYDLGTLMAHGPQQKLEDTEFAQPAIFVCSYIAFLSLKRTYPAMAKRFEQQVIDHEEKQQEEDGSRAGVHFAGFSLGEYTALAAAGVLTFADALRLVQVRAKSMKSAASARVGAMATVVGLSDQVLNEVVAKTLKARQDAQAQSLKDSMKEGGGSAETGLVTLSVANYLFENCRVLSGDLKSIEAVEVACKEAGASRIIRQKVSGAFHSPLMQTAVSAVRKELMVGCKLHSTPVHVYSNVSGGEHRGVVRVPSSVTSTASSTLDIQVSKSDVAAGAAAGVLADDLCAQLVSAVQWETTLHSLLRCPSGDEPPTVVALGPGRSLIAMLARIDKNAADKTLWMGE